MVRYFLHLRDGVDVALDEEGRLYEDDDELRVAAITAARDVMAEDVRHGRIDLHLRVEAEDENGRIVLVLPFRAAVTVFDAVRIDVAAE